MKVKYIAEGENGLETGKVYEVVSLFDDLYEIDDDGEYGVWDPELFEIVEGSVDDIDAFDFAEEDEGDK